MKKFFTIILAIMAIAIFLSGCSENTAKLTAEEEKLAKMYESLPFSTRQALAAENLVGMTVYNDSTAEAATHVLEVLMKNGATRAAKEDADLVISSTQNKDTISSINIIISDKNNNNFRQEEVELNDARFFAQQVANSIGTERKVKAIHASLTTKK